MIDRFDATIPDDVVEIRGACGELLGHPVAKWRTA